MCGIAGHLGNTDTYTDIIKRMLGSISHRGPDARSEYRDGPYHAGMCRLAINDLHFGGQPLFNRNRTVSLLYNGEIYNSPQLREELERKGYEFQTHSDGEVICHLYDECGEELFERLDGMFAVALWDSNRKRLLLARDLAGEKPLYYAKPEQNEIVFASEIRAIRQFPGLNLTLNRQAIWDFPTFLWIPEPDTIFHEIKAIPRGHILSVDREGISLTKYQNKFNTAPLPHTDDAVVEETRRVVSEAVKSRLLSDVPVGSFLSGGLDSSIVATLATQELGSIDTFSVGFELVSDPYHGTSDESEVAASYAKKLGSRHHTIRVTSASFRDDLDQFVHFADQPFGVSSGLGVMTVARAARDAGIKVLLSGDCADECFGGYSWYSYVSGAEASGRQCGQISVTNDRPVSFQNFGLGLAQRLKVLAAYDAPTRAWAWHYYAHENEKSALFSKEFQDGLVSSVRYFQAFDPSPEWSPEAFIVQDRDFYMPQEMLRKVDRMTMAYSVEGRVPFAAPAVLSHAAKLVYSDMVRGNVLKWSLRQAFSDLLPPEVTQRPKHGFNVPIDHWLKGEWRDLLDEAFSENSALRRYRIVGENARNVVDKMLNDPLRLNGHTVFCYIMLNRWLEGVH
jgi:asparagine synthase (glutamine-hydrolysing)